MAGLDPAIYVVVSRDPWTWMPGSSPGMTMKSRSATEILRCTCARR